MAHITTEEVRAIRNELKVQFPNMKFSVRKNDRLSVTVSVLSGDRDFSDIELRNFITDDVYHFDGYMQINHFHLYKYGNHQKFFQKVVDIIKTAPSKVNGGHEWYDNSDVMTDYFDVAFYFHVEIGRWNRPYEYKTAQKKAA